MSSNTQKKAIVTTTINPPTKALIKFAEIATSDDWHMFIVGDQKTPHEDYKEFCSKYECATYITPEDQEEISKELSDLIGWNCIQRRNFGIIAAYKWGADIIATIDDDNIPYPQWGKNVRLGEEFGVSEFKTESIVFDPLSVSFPNIWHRGFPIELIAERSLKKPQQKKRRVLVQADLWDGDPDVDAIGRIAYRPNVKFNPTMMKYASNVAGPFNSQNTFLHREIIPDYFLFPHIGRMDDIWASYVVQRFHPNSVVYAKASVVQERNEHNLYKDLVNEMLGYEHTLDFIKWLEKSPDGFFEPSDWPEYMPREAIDAYQVYREILAA